MDHQGMQDIANDKKYTFRKKMPAELGLYLGPMLQWPKKYCNLLKCMKLN